MERAKNEALSFAKQIEKIAEQEKEEKEKLLAELEKLRKLTTKRKPSIIPALTFLLNFAFLPLEKCKG